MLCDADTFVANQIPAPSCLASTGRTFSSSASSMKIRMSEQRGLGRLLQKYASIQSFMGELLDQNIPRGLTGYVKEPPRLVLTIDRKESVNLDSNVIKLVKNISIEKEKIAEITFKTQLESLQSELGLSITQLSQFFGVTRKSVYDWLDGTAPRNANSKRLEIMASVIASSNDRNNLKRLKGVWLTPINGKSFMDVIADDELGDEQKVAAASLKLDELAPRLGAQEKPKNKTYLGNAHTSDIDRVADLG